MPTRRQLDLAARFIAALHTATDGKTGQFRRAASVAERAGIKRPADIETAWKTAEAAGFLMTRVDEPGWVMLTRVGIDAARPKR